MPKLGNNYNLLREACYEASLLTLFFCRQINKIPLCLEQVFSVIDHRPRQNVCGSCTKTHFNIICDWLRNRHTAKRNQVVNYNKWFSQTWCYDINLTLIVDKLQKKKCVGKKIVQRFCLTKKILQKSGLKIIHAPQIFHPFPPPPPACLRLFLIVRPLQSFLWRRPVRVHPDGHFFNRHGSVLGWHVHAARVTERHRNSATLYYRTFNSLQAFF